MRLIYTIGIWFYTLGIRIAAMFGHSKASLMVRGWRDCLKADTGNTETIKHSSNQAIKTAWFHAASLGEFEQARPVLEAYRERHPEARIVVTFFSPSGYEVRKNYALADRVLYLPPDLPREVRRFVDSYRPTVAFFVKYEFWYNYLEALHKRHIPTYIFSAIFREGQYFFRSWGGWYLRQLRDCFGHLFVQNEASKLLLEGHGLQRVSVAGDTRYDRVHQIAQEAKPNAVVEQWLSAQPKGKTLVMGSSWEPDETLVSRYLQEENPALNLIIAPHVISEEHLRKIEQLFPGSVRYSVLKNQTNQNTPNNLNILRSTLIIDNIGLLSQLYRYADVAYIGGGFGAGIHNILEAVAYGKPVLFGPRYTKFQEACDIIDLGGGWSHTDYTTFVRNLTPLLSDPTAYARAAQACHGLMQRNLGSTELILNTLEE